MPTTPLQVGQLVEIVNCRGIKGRRTAKVRLILPAFHGMPTMYQLEGYVGAFDRSNLNPTSK